MLRRPCLVVAVVALALGVAGCGGGSRRHTVNRPPKKPIVIRIYSSLPKYGPQAAQSQAIADGIKLAFDVDPVDRFTVQYEALDDATAQAGGWDPLQTVANARRAASDRKAVLYIGELDASASEVSIPILNQAGIPQIGPVGTYAGLTGSVLGVTALNEPERYAASGVTYLQLPPVGTFEAAADLLALQRRGCGRVDVIHDGGVDGTAIAASIVADARDFGLTVITGGTLRTSGADCVVYAGAVSRAAVAVAKVAHAVLPPTGWILGTDGVCTAAWTNAADGGVPADVDPQLLCTSATPDLQATKPGRRFLADILAVGGITQPDPYTVWGYEAMKLALDTIAELGPDGDNRAAILAKLLTTRGYQSLVGTIGFESDGRSTLKSYNLYAVDPVSHDPEFDAPLNAAR